MDWRGIGAEVLQAAAGFKYFCWLVQIFLLVGSNIFAGGFKYFSLQRVAARG